MSISFLIKFSAFAAVALSTPALATPLVPLPLRGVAPELLAAAMLSLGALAAAWLQQQRARGALERGSSLERQLDAARAAQAEAEAALAASHEVLCRLVRGQEGVRDAERSRIARELHDELGHRLLSLRVELALQQAAVRGTSPALHDRLTATIGGLDGAIRSVRAIVGGLRPIAAGVSLRQAAERHLADFARLHGLDYRFDAGAAGDGVADAAPNPERDAVLFRVLQEALSNVARHARATTVCVDLSQAVGETMLRIEDDGIGPPPAVPSVGSGCGIDGMRERTEAYGGSFSLARGRRGGTVVCVRLPWQRHPAPA
jgi:signal transduction histidine kinase